MKLLGCSGHGEWGGAENSKEQEQSCQFYGGRLRAEEVQAREPFARSHWRQRSYLAKGTGWGEVKGESILEEFPYRLKRGSGRF